MTGLSEASMAKLLRFGFFSDGVFKVLVAVAYVATLSWLADVLDVRGWLIAVTALVVAASGVAEIAFAVRSASGSHTRYLVAYDASWVIVTAAAIAMYTGDVAGYGLLWLGFQVVAASVLAVVFAAGARHADRPRVASAR